MEAEPWAVGGFRLEAGVFTSNLKQSAPPTGALALWAGGKPNAAESDRLPVLHIAQGSLYEVVTLNEIFRRKTLFSDEESTEIRKRCEQIDRKLNGLINSLKQNKRKSSAGKLEE